MKKNSTNPSITLRKFLLEIDQAALRFLALNTPDEIYQAIVWEALRLLAADYGTILLYRKGELKRIYSNHEIIAAAAVRQRGRAYQAFKSRQPVITRIETKADINAKIYKLNIKSIIFIPLTYRQKSIGVLNILSKQQEQLSKDQLGMLKLYGSLACLAINKGESYMETKSALEARELFMEMASHELKTPVTSIYGYLQLIRQYTDVNRLPKKDWVDSITAETTRLIKLIQELLQVGTTREPFFIDFERLHLKKLLCEAEKDFKIIHTDRELETEVKLSLKEDIIFGDKDKLLRMLTNILDNAVKFSPQKSKIILKAKKIGKKIHITIKDFGQGISREDLNKLFDKFYRGRGHDREGMGLGLFLVKEIVRKHRGKIDIKSKMNIGTTVKIILPSYI
ncbi:GAF domain-containing sensor histidine kinase [Candidatus Daviesbacteria bacterium]|nr:GAF domain-containing sensor histidine kinase [Candidatus Daviesbacteria bacterium]